jgi:hypothetical protein
MNRMQLLTIAAAVAASMALSGPAAAQQWQDVPTSPRITVPAHGVEVSIAAVYHNLLTSHYIQIRERTIGSPEWRPVYGHQHASTTIDADVKQAGGYVQYINGLVPAYNVFLATRYPPLSSGPVFGTGALDQLNKALYESFRLLAQGDGKITIGPK